VGEGYIHDANENKAACRARWNTSITEAGNYEVILHFPANPNRATNVPVTIAAGDLTKTVTVNEREKSGATSLGIFPLAAGAGLTVTVTNAGTDGYVVLDGLQILRR